MDVNDLVSALKTGAIIKTGDEKHSDEDVVSERFHVKKNVETNTTISGGRFFRVDRDRVLDHISLTDVMLNAHYLDSDIFEYTSDGAVKKIVANKHRYISNECFNNVKELDDYLRSWGKIPSFLEMRDVLGKGYGVFTTKKIQRGTFLGTYTGLYKFQNDTTNKYLFSVRDAKNVNVIFASADAENIMFANWTRFVNDGKTPNTEFFSAAYQVFLFSNKDINANEELIASYGEGYWKNMESRGIKKLD